MYSERQAASAEREVEKQRRRAHILYQETDLAINLDQLSSPEPNSCYLEIKARTWSAKDALHKAELISELLEKFGIKREDQFTMEYIDLMP